MRTFFSTLFGLLVFASWCEAKSDVIQDFEGDGFDSWQTTGTAFGLSPIAGKMDGLFQTFPR